MAKRLTSRTVVLFCTLSVLSNYSTTAQEFAPCSIEIRAPKRGDRVGVRAQINGSATVPAGLHLWVFVRKSGQTNWWPQGGGSAEVSSSGKWERDGAFGDENDVARDAGARFEITAVTVDSAGDAKLATYVETTEKTGRYPGTRIPPAPANGCSLRDHIVVTRE